MTIDSVPELARRVRHLETLVKRGKPADGSDNASLLKRISALESSVARIGKAAPTKPQVYTPKPAVRVPKPTDNSLALKLAALEREVERLRVKESPGAWQSWTPSSQTGWTAMPTGSYRYSRVGKLVYCVIAITAGTSNGAKAEIALPVTASTSATVSRGTWGWAMDDGTQVNPAGGYALSTTMIKFFKTSIDGASWTASGTKRVYCMFFYEAA